MKRTSLLLLLTLFLLINSVSFAEVEADETQAPGAPAAANVPIALLYEESTGTVLFSRAPDRKNAPASMTKVMTAILVLEYDPELSGTTVVAPEAMSEENCYWLDVNHLEVGEEISVRDLMNYLLIASGNEAGTTLAMYVAGDIPTFIAMMNAKAQELGMENTFYQDPHGLSPMPQATTANDMLKLCLYAMKNETFREIVSTKEGVIPASNKRNQPFRYGNSNRVLRPQNNPRYDTGFTEDIIGIKTGYIGSAGYNLACCMVHGDLTFYSIVMQGKELEIDGATYYSHYLDTVELMQYARTFTRCGYEPGDVVMELTVNGDETLPLTVKESVAMLVQEGAQAETVCDIAVEPQGDVTAGDAFGTLTLTDAFGNVRTAELVSMVDMEIRPTFVPEYLIGGAVVLVIAAVVCIVLLRKRARAKAQSQADMQAEV